MFDLKTFLASGLDHVVVHMLDIDRPDFRPRIAGEIVRVGDVLVYEWRGRSVVERIMGWSDMTLTKEIIELHQCHVLTPI